MSSRAFEARWPGKCAECGDGIDVGDEARFNDDEEIVGEDCCGHAYEWVSYSERGYR